eukprot:786836-Pelagomonas_calceolata.AAC.1
MPISHSQMMGMIYEGMVLMSSDLVSTVQGCIATEEFFLRGLRTLLDRAILAFPSRVPQCNLSCYRNCPL